MLKISAVNNQIKLENQNGANFIFAISDIKLFNVIKKNIEAVDSSGCSIQIEKFDYDTSVLTLGNRFKLRIGNLTAYELTSRMMLLNDKLTFPEMNFDSLKEE